MGLQRSCLREIIAAIDREKARRLAAQKTEAEARHKGATTKDKDKKEVEKKR